MGFNGKMIKFYLLQRVSMGFDGKFIRSYLHRWGFNGVLMQEKHKSSPFNWSVNRVLMVASSNGICANMAVNGVLMRHHQTLFVSMGC